MTLKLQDPDLTADSSACWVVKDEVVSVEFAVAPGVIESAVGLNRHAAGDALLTGSTGDRWSVSRDRFDAKYQPEAPLSPGLAGKYRNRRVPILAKRMNVDFTVARSAGGDVLTGNAGDWLLQYSPGDHGVVARARFEAVYRMAAAHSEPLK
jgi:hypothetical protein